VGLMNSVLKNEEAITRYVRQLKPGIDPKIISHLKNSDFWASLEQARDILEPIHQTQYLSEAEDYSLSRVLENWNRIRADLYSKAKKYPTIECLTHIADVIWEDRMLNQSTTLHVVSALLLPRNHDIKVVGLTTSPAFNTIMMSFFVRYTSSPHDAGSAMKQWLAFRSQIDGFQPNAECWR